MSGDSGDWSTRLRAHGDRAGGRIGISTPSHPSQRILVQSFSRTREWSHPLAILECAGVQRELSTMNTVIPIRRTRPPVSTPGNVAQKDRKLLMRVMLLACRSSLSVLTASPLCQLLLPVRPEIIGKIMLLACRSNAFADPRPSSLPARPRATPWPKDRAWGPGPEQVLPRLHRCPRTFPNPGPHCYWRSDCRGFASTVGWCRADRASHAVADLDGDTVPDLVTAEIVGPKPWITRQRAPYL